MRDVHPSSGTAYGGVQDKTASGGAARARSSAFRPGQGDPLRRLDPQLVPPLVLAGALALSLWARSSGYQLADSVEYLEHAQAFVRGREVVDSTAIRSFGFSALLSPLFWLADRLGVEDFRPLVALLRLLQVAVALLVVRATARLAALVAGRQAGIAAAWFAAGAPVLLRYAYSPIADPLAALFVAGGIERLLRRAGVREGLKAGLWLGAALLVAYKTVLVSAPLFLLVLLRERLEGRRLWLGAAGGYALAVLAGAVLDFVRYGAFGESLRVYFGQNFGGVLATLVGRLGMVELAKRLYELSIETQTGSDYSAANAVMGDVQQMLPAHFYLTHAPEALGWLTAALAALGVVTVLVRPRWPRVLALGIVVLAFVPMSVKGAKEWRLALPLLPLVLSLAALGWRALAGEAPAGRRRAVARLLLPLAVLLGGFVAHGRNLERYGGYWRALDFVAERARAQRAPDAPPARVVSAWHWAVFLREPPSLELVKLPHHLDSWSRYDRERRQASLATLRGASWFITHLAVLSNHPSLLRAVGVDFAVVGLLWDRETFEDLGPILVLERRRGRPDEPPLLDVIDGVDAGAVPPGQGLVFERPRPGGGPPERLRLVEARHVVLPPDGHGWLTLSWLAETPLAGDFVVLDRVTTEPPTHDWRDDHRPGYGAAATPGWPAGRAVREGRPLVAASEPFDWRAPYRPLGEGLAGPLVPAPLWIALVDAAGGPPLAPIEPPGAPPLPRDGEGRVRVATLSLPAPSR